MLDDWGFDPFAGRDPLAALFPPGTVRATYDATSPVHLFKDTAMTLPVTAVGDAVAAIRDPWGGYHATQALPTKRALYGRHPPQIRQLLANSAFLGAVSGTPGTAATGWSWQAPTGTVTAPGDETLTFSGTAARQIMIVQPSLAASETKIFSAKVIANPNGLMLYQLILALNGPAGVTLNYYANGVLVNEATYVPVAGDLIAVKMTTTGTGGVITCRIGLGCFAVATGSVTLTEPQFEVGSSRTAYQRSAGIHDITETGQPSIYGLRTDGVDDCYVTPIITPGTDEVCVLASVYKMSDAGAAMVAEFGPSVGTTSGTFCLMAPDSAGFGRYLTTSTGGTQRSVAVNYAAPHAAVLEMLADIAAPSLSLRANGNTASITTSSQGSGNYTPQILNIGARAGTSLFWGGWLHNLTVGFALPTDAALIRAKRHLGTRSWIAVA